MKNLPSIFIVGPMGAGKSTIGRLLAQDLKMEFKDSDREIEERAGADISWIFDVEGEEGFRVRETAVLADLTGETDIVLATGGGAVLRKENRDNLASRGVVVYLAASVDQQVERTRQDRKRPLLQTDDPRDVLENLMGVRDPLYREVADHVVITDRQNPKVVVQEIMSLLQQQNLLD